MMLWEQFFHPTLKVKVAPNLFIKEIRFPVKMKSQECHVNKIGINGNRGNGIDKMKKEGSKITLADYMLILKQTLLRKEIFYYEKAPYNASCGFSPMWLWDIWKVCQL